MSEALAPWSGVPRSETERLIRDAMPMPAFRPPVEDLVVSSSGDIWLRRESTPDTMSVWEIRDREGGLKGRLNLPSGVTVIAVSDSVVWSSQLDPWDVPVVSKNRLVRRWGTAIDEEGRLWVQVRVYSDDWPPESSDDLGDVSTTITEVIDLKTGRLIARGEFGEALTGLERAFTPYSQRSDNSGYSVLDAWRLELIQDVDNPSNP